MGGYRGIGSWSQIIELIGLFAACTNACLFVYVMRTGLRSKEKSTKLVWFVCIAGALLFIRFIGRAFIPEEPADVLRIRDFNGKVKRIMMYQEGDTGVVRESEKMDSVKTHNLKESIL